MNNNFDLLYQEIPHTYNKYDRITIREEKNLQMPARLGINNWVDEIRFRSFVKSTPRPRIEMVESFEDREAKTLGISAGIPQLIKTIAEIKFPIKRILENGEDDIRGGIDQLSLMEIITGVHIRQRMSRLRVLYNMLVRGQVRPILEMREEIVDGVLNQDVLINLVREALKDLKIKEPFPEPIKDIKEFESKITTRELPFETLRNLQEALVHIDMTRYRINEYETRGKRDLIDVFDQVFNTFMSQQAYSFINNPIIKNKAKRESFPKFQQYIKNKYSDVGEDELQLDTDVVIDITAEYLNTDETIEILNEHEEEHEIDEEADEARLREIIELFEPRPRERPTPAEEEEEEEEEEKKMRRIGFEPSPSPEEEEIAENIRQTLKDAQDKIKRQIRVMEHFDNDVDREEHLPKAISQYKNALLDYIHTIDSVYDTLKETKNKKQFKIEFDFIQEHMDLIKQRMKDLEKHLIRLEEKKNIIERMMGETEVEKKWKAVIERLDFSWKTLRTYTSILTKRMRDIEKEEEKEELEFMTPPPKEEEEKEPKTPLQKVSKQFEDLGDKLLRTPKKDIGSPQWDRDNRRLTRLAKRMITEEEKEMEEDLRIAQEERKRKIEKEKELTMFDEQIKREKNYDELQKLKVSFDLTKKKIDEKWIARKKILDKMVKELNKEKKSAEPNFEKIDRLNKDIANISIERDRLKRDYFIINRKRNLVSRKINQMGLEFINERKKILSQSRKKHEQIKDTNTLRKIFLDLRREIDRLPDTYIGYEQSLTIRGQMEEILEIISERKQSLSHLWRTLQEKRKKFIIPKLHNKFMKNILAQIDVDIKSINLYTLHRQKRNLEEIIKIEKKRKGEEKRNMLKECQERLQVLNMNIRKVRQTQSRHMDLNPKTIKRFIKDAIAFIKWTKGEDDYDIELFKILARKIKDTKVAIDMGNMLHNAGEEARKNKKDKEWKKLNKLWVILHEETEKLYKDTIAMKIIMKTFLGIVKLTAT